MERRQRAGPVRGLIARLGISCAVAVAVPLSAAEVLLTEVHYHPSAAQGRAEFVEARNAGKEAVDVSGWRFTRGIRFTFPPGSRLAPGAVIVVCEDLAGFRAAFPAAPAPAGAFQGKLYNAGETLRLVDATGTSVTDLSYGSSVPWPREADGAGASLERREDGDADDPASWRGASPTPGAPPAAMSGERPLSLHSPRREPASAQAGRPVAISVRLSGTNPGARVRLHWESAGGAQRTAVMKEGAPGSPGKDPVFLAELPAMPPGTLTRYWFQAADSRGRSARLPHSAAPTPHLAVFAGGEEPATKLPFYQLLMDPAELLSLDQDPFSNRLRPAVFIAGGEVFDRVGVRCRGAWARSWQKKSWKVVFPDDHRFRKRRSLNLNSAWRDPAFIREALAYEVYRRAGSLSLQARMVRVHVNGEFWALFCEVENAGKRLLARSGLAGAGLYKAASRANLADERAFASPKAMAGHYSRESGPDAGLEELHRFLQALHAAREPRRLLEERLDVPRYLSYLAAGAFLQNWDSFSKNHFLIHDKKGPGKWSALPWDLDRTLGDHWNWTFDFTGLPLYLGTERFPGPTGWNRLQERFLADPESRKLFETRLRELLDGPFTLEALRPAIAALREAIVPEADLDRRRWGGEADWRRGIDQLERFIVERREFLLAQLPGGEPEAPATVAPAAETVAAPRPVVLECAPFRHAEAKVTHRATRWQVRSEPGSWATPLVDRISEQDLLRLTLPHGFLPPRTKVIWRAFHAGSNGKTSPASPEASFSTGHFAWTPVRFELSRHFHRDVVADPGDPSTDPLDDQGGSLLLHGFDGARTGNPLAQGLPRDRAVGIHLLGDYARPNVLQLTPRDRRWIRIEVPPRRYSFLRFLVAGGGDSVAPLLLEHDQGVPVRVELPCDDWYDDPPPDGPPESLSAGSVPILNGLDRLRAGVFKDRDDPAIFEVVIAADPSRTLRAIVIDGAAVTYAVAGRGRFNLFAITGIVMGGK